MTELEGGINHVGKSGFDTKSAGWGMVRGA